MKSRIIVVSISVIIAFVIVSAGYSLWEEKLVIIGNVTVTRPQVINAENQDDASLNELVSSEVIISEQKKTEIIPIESVSEPSMDTVSLHDQTQIADNIENLENNSGDKEMSNKTSEFEQASTQIPEGELAQTPAPSYETEIIPTQESIEEPIQETTQEPSERTFTVDESPE